MVLKYMILVPEAHGIKLVHRQYKVPQELLTGMLAMVKNRRV